MNIFSTSATVVRTAAHAAAGRSFSDKRLAFYLAGLGILGPHRQQLRQKFLQRIDSQAVDGFVTVHVKHLGTPTRLVMRQGNIGDYLVGGEFVRGSYPAPPFVPEQIIDGGGNIGTFTVHASRVAPKAEIISFEPDPDNLEVLAKNIELNGVNCRLEKKAMWPHGDRIQFEKGQADTGHVTESGGELSIECGMPEVRENCWLKLDIEGAEYEVLPVLLEKRLPRAISMELHHVQKHGRKLTDLLRSRGYHVTGDEDCSIDCFVIEARLA